MPRKETLSPELEQRRVFKMYRQLRSVIQKQLDTLETSEDGPSAALMDALVRSMKGLNSLLADLTKSQEDLDRKEQSKAALETIQAEMPFRGADPLLTPTQTQPKTSEDAAMKEPMEFPFPTLKTR